MRSPHGDSANEAKPRRAARFWQPLNTWWRAFLAEKGRRPTAADVQIWYNAHAHTAWPQPPSWKEARVHAKCLRSTEQVRNYFREYRMRSKFGIGGSAGGTGGGPSTSSARLSDTGDTGDYDDVSEDGSDRRSLDERRGTASLSILVPDSGVAGGGAASSVGGLGGSGRFRGPSQAAAAGGSYGAAGAGLLPSGGSGGCSAGTPGEPESLGVLVAAHNARLAHIAGQGSPSPSHSVGLPPGAYGAADFTPTSSVKAETPGVFSLPSDLAAPGALSPETPTPIFNLLNPATVTTGGGVPSSWHPKPVTDRLSRFHSQHHASRDAGGSQPSWERSASFSAGTVPASRPSTHALLPQGSMRRSHAGQSQGPSWEQPRQLQQVQQLQEDSSMYEAAAAQAALTEYSADAQAAEGYSGAPAGAGAWTALLQQTGSLQSGLGFRGDEGQRHGDEAPWQALPKPANRRRSFQADDEYSQHVQHTPTVPTPGPYGQSRFARPRLHPSGGSITSMPGGTTALQSAGGAGGAGLMQASLPTQASAGPSFGGGGPQAYHPPAVSPGSQGQQQLGPRVSDTGGGRQPFALSPPDASELHAHGTQAEAQAAMLQAHGARRRRSQGSGGTPQPLPPPTSHKQLAGSPLPFVEGERRSPGGYDLSAITAADAPDTSGAMELGGARSGSAEGLAAQLWALADEDSRGDELDEEDLRLAEPAGMEGEMEAGPGMGPAVLENLRQSLAHASYSSLPERPSQRRFSGVYQEEAFLPESMVAGLRRASFPMGTPVPSLGRTVSAAAAAAAGIAGGVPRSVPEGQALTGEALYYHPAERQRQGQGQGQQAPPQRLQGSGGSLPGRASLTMAVYEQHLQHQLQQQLQHPAYQYQGQPQEQAQVQEHRLSWAGSMPRLKQEEGQPAPPPQGQQQQQGLHAPALHAQQQRQILHSPPLQAQQSYVSDSAADADRASPEEEHLARLTFQSLRVHSGRFLPPRPTQPPAAWPPPPPQQQQERQRHQAQQEDKQQMQW